MCRIVQVYNLLMSECEMEGSRWRSMHFTNLGWDMPIRARSAITMASAMLEAGDFYTKLNIRDMVARQAAGQRSVLAFDGGYQQKMNSTLCVQVFLDANVPVLCPVFATFHCRVVSANLRAQNVPHCKLTAQRTEVDGFETGLVALDKEYGALPSGKERIKIVADGDADTGKCLDRLFPGDNKPDKDFDPNHFFKNCIKVIMGVGTDVTVQALHACPEENGGCPWKELLDGKLSDYYKGCGSVTFNTARWGYKRGIYRAWKIALAVQLDGGTDDEYVQRFHKEMDAVLKHCSGDHTQCDEDCPYQTHTPREKDTSHHHFRFVTCKPQVAQLHVVLRDYFCRANLLLLSKYHSNIAESFNALINKQLMSAKGQPAFALGYLNGGACAVAKCGETAQLWRWHRDNGPAPYVQESRHTVHLELMAGKLGVANADFAIPRRGLQRHLRTLRLKAKDNAYNRLATTNAARCTARNNRRQANVERKDGPVDPTTEKYRGGNESMNQYRTAAKSRKGKKSGGGTYQKAGNKKYRRQDMVDQIQVWFANNPNLDVFQGSVTFYTMTGKNKGTKAQIRGQWDQVKDAVDLALAEGREEQAGEGCIGTVLCGCTACNVAIDTAIIGAGADA